MIFKQPISLWLCKAEPTANELRGVLRAQDLLTTKLERQFQNEVAFILSKYAKKAASDAASVGAYFNYEVSLEGMNTELLVAFAKQYRRTINTFGQDFFDGLEKSWTRYETKDQAGIFSSFLNSYISNNAAVKVTQVADTTKKIIRNAIQSAISASLGPEGMARLIVLKAGGAASKIRALTIARTETHNAAQYGQQAASDSTGLQFRKYWIASDDERVRADHEEAESDSRSNIIKNDQPFSVGGEALMYPGDPTGSAGQVINCRCGVARRPIAI